MKSFFVKSTILIALTAGFLSSFHLQKHYKVDEYDPSQDAYVAGEVLDPVGAFYAEKSVTPTDPFYSYQLTRSHSENMIGDLEHTWDSYTGKDVVVAVIDDGFDVNHPEYVRDGKSIILDNSRNFYYDQSKNTVYYQTYSAYRSCLDEDWVTPSGEEARWNTHGTSTTTTIAAQMNNGGTVGIAPDIKILALKCDFAWASIKIAIEYAVSQHVDIINMSISGYQTSFTDPKGTYHAGTAGVEDYLNEACEAAYNAGIIVIAAAGNDASTVKSYPACNSHVIGVGALGKNTPNTFAPFTNYNGSSQTGEVNVDILAPGYVYTGKQTGSQSIPTHGYGDTQGTSFSAPIVAGVAALWKEKYPNGTPDEFLEQLQSTASDIGTYASRYIPVSAYSGVDSDVGPSNITNGRVNISNLLDIDSPYVRVSHSSYDLLVDETKQIEIVTSNGDISYSSSDTNIATVSNTGLITAKAVGTVTISVIASKNEETHTANIEVDVGIPVEDLYFDPSSITLDIGDTYNAEQIIVIDPSNATRSFLFASNDESVVTVDDYTGLITAVGEGSTSVDVLARFGDGLDSLTVTVNPPAPKTLTSISISGYKSQFNVGDTFTFNGTVNAHFDDDSVVNVTSDSTFSGYDMNESGNQTVTVSYTYLGVTKTATYQITVKVVVVEQTFTIGWGNASGTSGTYENFSGTSGTVTNILSFSSAQNNGTNPPAISSNQLRLYYGGTNGNGCSVTITPASGVTITGFVIHAVTNQPTVKYSVNGGNKISISTSNLTYTVNNISATSSLMIQNGNTSNTQLRIGTLDIKYVQEDLSDKVMNSLSASYTGGDVYVGGSLNTSALTVTASYTKSGKYPSETLDAEDYSLSAFDSSSAGEKTITVTYTGDISTSVTPLTTTFNVIVIEDSVSGVSVTANKIYHPGDTIVKADISFALEYESGKQETITDFIFNDDGYQFIYEDAASGGALTNKTFTNTIEYNSAHYSLTVQVSRVDHQSTVGETDTLTRATTGVTSTSNYDNWNGKVGASGSIYAGNSCGGNTSIQLRSNNSNSGIVMTSSSGGVKSVSVTWNSGTASGRILEVYGKNTAYSAATDLYDSATSGDLLGTIIYGTSTSLTISGSYSYIGVKSSQGALYLTNISFLFGGDENAENFANYLMYEDTENQCESKLDTAITYFEDMSTEERSTFMTSNDYVIKTARNRFNAWLANQKKSISYVDGDYVISSNHNSFTFDGQNSNETIIILVSSIFFCLSLLGCLYLTKRKKYN